MSDEFIIPARRKQIPSSPEELFYRLSRADHIKYLYAPQQKILDGYMREAVDAADVALELPTGAGKTLVGLLLADYRRQTRDEVSLYLCPTRQLAVQVASQATDYGIPAVLLSGKKREWDSGDMRACEHGEAVGIMTYSGLFNSSPGIATADFIICDDAHAASQSVAQMWSFELSRETPELLAAVLEYLRPLLPTNVAVSLTDPHSEPYVDAISPMRLAEHLTDFRRFMEKLLEGDELRWDWGRVSPHLESCLVYCSRYAVAVRPYIPPTAFHPPFADARQRLYMTATAGNSGFIQRAFGIESMVYLAAPAELAKLSTGKRLVLLPEYLESEDTEAEVLDFAVATGRSLFITTSNARATALSTELTSRGVQVFVASETDAAVQQFKLAEKPVALVAAGRYDGIDLPGDSCRLLVIDGLPRGMGLQERFFKEKLRAVAESRDAIRTRLVQALGRCTRDEADYAVVLLMGSELTSWVARKVNTTGLHPELRAELEFGYVNSSADGRSLGQALALAATFLDDRGARRTVEEAILDIASDLDTAVDGVALKLGEVVQDEVVSVEKSWAQDHEAALKAAELVLESLSDGNDLTPYKGAWHLNAANAAFFANAAPGSDEYRQACLRHLRAAQQCLPGVGWISQLIAPLEGELPLDWVPEHHFDVWISTIHSLMREWLSAGRFAAESTELESLLTKREAKSFERGISLLGRALGARVHVWSEDAAPDGFWDFGTEALVFEAKTGAEAETPISLKTVRQARTHEERVRADNLVHRRVPITTVLISSQVTLQADALPHAGSIKLVRPEQFQEFAAAAVAVLRFLRARYRDLGDGEFEQVTTSEYQSAGIDFASVVSALKSVDLKDMETTL